LKKDGILYYSLTNNFSLPENQYKKKNHGLNFIRRIFEELYKMSIKTEYNETDNTFIVFIPIPIMINH
jgi:hypothetical protein